METKKKKKKKKIKNNVSKKQPRPGIFQLYVPIYHEDGDMIDVFITSNDKGHYSLCDYGMTLQRLSYSYDIDTENKEAILQKIILENGLYEEDGNICLKTKIDTIYTDIMHITQAYAKIGSMRYFKREVIENLFYEILDEFITVELQEFNPKTKVLPIPDRDDLEADYSFSLNGHPIYLFGVKDVARARLATISCLEYQKANLNFRGWVVNENFEALPKKDRTRLTNTCDKQFTSLEEFKASAKMFLERERH
jgi:hypothetical protein